MTYSFLIVDDEELSRNYIAALIQEFCAEARIAGSVSNTAQARKILMEEDIDILFLDIKMSGETGIEFLQSLKDRSSFKTVFVTAYSNYAIKAIKTAAFDYLLKPIDKTEFKATLNRLTESIQSEYYWKSKGLPAENYLDQKLTVHHSNGFRLIALRDIVYLQASNNYTNIKLNNGETVIVSKSLKDFQIKLDQSWFFRIHKSYLINISYADQYLSEDGGLVLMKNGDKICISRYRLADFFSFVTAFTKGLKA